jgi:hypothetical protein
MWLKWLPWKYLARRAARSYGFIDPIGLLAHVRRFAQPSEVAVPLELLRAGMAFHARGFINSRVIQQNLDWVWPGWVHRQFDPRSASFVPRAFSLTHVNLTGRNWTAIGVPDFEGLPIVDPHGLVTPFWDGWSLDAWVVTGDDRRLIPARLQKPEQCLDIAEGLAVETSSKQGCLELHVRAEVLPETNPICRVTWRAMTNSPGWLVISARPYNPEGISFIHRLELAPTRMRWIINDEHYVDFDEPVDVHYASNYARGDVAQQLLEANHEDSMVCDVGMTTAAAYFKTTAKRSRQITVRIPLIPKASHVRTMAERDRAVAVWSDSLTSVCRLDVPDKRMRFLYDAAVRTLVLHSPADVYPGPYTYKRFWFRDAVFILQAMLCVGLHQRAERVIGRFFPRQSPAGYFRSQDGEWDSNGQVLWILRRFCELTGREPEQAWYGSVRKAWRWIARKRLSAKTDTPHAGLLPAGFSAEHFGPNDYYYWDDFWSVAGLFSAARLLRSWNRPAEARRCDDEACDLLEAIEHSLKHARDRLGRHAMPTSCYRRLDSGAVGSIVAGYPIQLLSADDRRLLETTNYLLANCTVRGGFFQDMIHSGINAYLTLHLAQVLLRAGDERFADLLRATRDLASPTGQWPEAIHPRTQGGCMGDGQHAWAAAEWIMMLRNCLLFEETHTQRLIIGAGILPEWLRSGQQISIGPAPTSWGLTRLTVDCSAEAATVSWDADWFDEAPEVEIRLPGAEPVVVSAGDSTQVRIAVRCS